MACHDLTTTLAPPANLKTLLGLGLNFCLQARQTTACIREQCDRFRRDMFIKMFFAGSSDDDSDFDPRFHIRSEWEPPEKLIKAEFRNRVDNFLTTIQSKFRRRVVRTNLLRHQSTLLQAIRHSPNHIVFPADKNLGPAIVERRMYITKAFDEHLSNPAAYQQLTKQEAQQKILSIKTHYRWFRMQYHSIFSDQENKFLNANCDPEDPYCHFYLLAKVHKTPWKTRPIVSTSGSLLEGLGKWIDKQLQPLCKDIPSYVKNSASLVQELLELPPLPPTALLLTADAVSMYTNIDTDHGLTTLKDVLPDTATGRATHKGLSLLMRNNVFKFGDTFWLQLSGTAMGTPPAPPYATLYYSAREEYLLQAYRDYLLFYRRYIDDVFAIWDFNSHESYNAFARFQSDMKFGTLDWEVDQPSVSVNFLDLHLYIADDNRVHTKLHEKVLNLYLYIPPHSCHPPGVLKGLIFGAFHRVFTLTSQSEERKRVLSNLLRRLCRCGYRRDKLLPLFHTAYARYNNVTTTTQCPPTAPTEPTGQHVILHMPYHPLNPSSALLQQTYQHTIIQPPNDRHVSSILNHTDAPFSVNRMIVAYHRPPNIKNLVFPRRLRVVPGQEVSTVISQL